MNLLDCATLASKPASSGRQVSAFSALLMVEQQWICITINLSVCILHLWMFFCVVTLWWLRWVSMVRAPKLFFLLFVVHLCGSGCNDHKAKSPTFCPQQTELCLVFLSWLGSFEFTFLYSSYLFLPYAFSTSLILSLGSLKPLIFIQISRRTHVRKLSKTQRRNGEMETSI